MKNQPIRFRNAITELWNAGHTTAYIAQQNGLSHERVRDILVATRNGYNTPEDWEEAGKPHNKSGRK